jgi:hypothetical protein
MYCIVMLCRAMQCSVVQCSAHKSQAVSHSVTQTRVERLQRLYAFIHMKCTSAYYRLHPFSPSNPNKKIVTYRLVLLATNSTLHYTTVQYSAVHYSTVQYSTVQYSTVQYSTVQYSTVQYSTVQYSTVQYTELLN